MVHRSTIAAGARKGEVLRMALLCAAALVACESTKQSDRIAAGPSTPVPLEAPPAPASLLDLPSEPIAAAGEAAPNSIVIAGSRIPIAAPVVLWTDEGGYSAYGTESFFGGAPRADGPTGLRYKPGRRTAGGEIEAPSLAELAECIDQFVLHFDVCGVSRQCFKVLHDIRGLSVHFLLDIDGTLYQTLDLADTAWHARQANPRSIGVEIANMGAYPPGRPSALDEWYRRDGQGWRIVLPERLGDGGLRRPQFIGRPARPERIEGLAQGQTLEQFDFTPEQYETLVALGAVLCRVLPRIEPDAPRDAAGRVRTDALAAEEFEEFHGILGHHHVTDAKNDPGPAMDWEGFLERVRERLEAP